jgi:hypothetical protein
VEETAIKLPSGPGAPLTDAAQSVPMAPPEDDSPPPWLGVVDWILLGLAVVLSVVVSSVPATNADVWMQLATGRLIAHGEYIPGGADPFSCATAARDGQEASRWVNHSWLYALLLYALYSVAGPIGVIIAKGILMALLMVVLIQVRARDTNKFIVAVCLTLTVIALSLRLGPPLQPVLVSYLFLGITLFILYRAGVLGGSDAESQMPTQPVRLLWWLPLLFILWVNFDNWFILGPITLALCWLGLAVQRWRGVATPVPLGKFGALCGGSVLACLINPSHVWAFQLPPDLSYLLVQAGNAAGIHSPDALTGGGRTLALMQEGDGERTYSLFSLSPLNGDYFTDPNFGHNIAGICFYALLGLGLVSFIVTGLVSGKPGAPVAHAVRFLIWFGFAVLAVLNFRLIPLFAVVAGPLTALNLGELLAWYAAPQAAGAEPTPWVAPARMVRLLSVPLMLALLMFAWTGWLNGPLDFSLGEFGSARHVAWEIPVDPSLRLAAQRLGEIQRTRPAGQSEVRVFSSGFDLSCYCAWFAPGVKGFVDPRLNLMTPVVTDFLQARRGPVDRQNRPNKALFEVMRRYGIEYVAVEDFLTRLVDMNQVSGWWRDPTRWRQEFADRKVALFAWSHDRQRWPTDAVIEDWNRLAFGPVAEADRPPSQGPPPPPDEQPGWWDRFLMPPPRLPQTALDMDAKRAYAVFLRARAMELAAKTVDTPTYSVISQPLVPGSFVTPYAWFAGTAGLAKFIPQWQDQRQGGPFPFFATTDAVVPAVPLLMVRRARQTVAAAPEYERSYGFLTNAIIHAREEEDYWVAGVFRGNPPQTLRSRLRGVQAASAMRTAIDVGITDTVRQYTVHSDLAQHYLQKFALDLALEETRVAEEAVAAKMQESPQQEEGLREFHKQLASQHKGLKDMVDKRKDLFGVTMANKRPLEKVGELLFGAPRQVDKDNKPVQSRGWGLTGHALELLLAIDPRSLAEKERRQWEVWTIDLLFHMGFSRKATEELYKALEYERGVAKAGPDLPSFAMEALPFLVLSAGTQGNYDDLQQVLANWERILAERVRGSLVRAYATGLMAPPPLVGYTNCTLGVPILRVSGPGHLEWMNFNTLVESWLNTSNEYFNLRTLRGIMALEAGDTAGAYQMFDDALRESGAYYLERPIAERYRALLAPYADLKRVPVPKR